MICPNCHSDVNVSEKDFGALFNCPKCQTAYFINFEGKPEFSDEEFIAPENLEVHDAISQPEIGLPDEESLRFDSSLSDFNSNQNPITTEFENGSDRLGGLGEQQLNVLGNQFGEIQDMRTTENNFDSINSLSDSESAPVAMDSAPPFEPAFSNVASEILNFGNSETQISALNYDLQIAGLDTRDDLLAFKEVIEDSRFGWEPSDVMRQIKNGEVLLQKLNPVQAYVLAKRLHFLDLEMKWKQNVLE